MEDEEAVTVDHPEFAMKGFRTLRQMDRDHLNDLPEDPDEDDPEDWDFSSD